ncbi:tRNA (guanosine(18)-2'-O)-methyltransferase TrmH [Kistimonas scapharcae]
MPVPYPMQTTMTPERFQKLRTALDRRQPDLALLTDQVHKAHNLAAILRTCDAVGIDTVHLSQSPLRARQLRRRSMGSNRWVNVATHNSIDAGIRHFQERRFKVYAAHFSERAKPYHELDFTVPCVLLMGAEKYGVSETGAQLADEHVIIPMQGMVESYNVSVAAAIILAEAMRQRERQGLYRHSRLEPECYRRTLFRWCYPELARYCDERQATYPAIDDNGLLVDPSDWYEKIRQSSKKHRKS